MTKSLILCFFLANGLWGQILAEKSQFTLSPKEFQNGISAYHIGDKLVLKTSIEQEAKIRQKLKLIEQKFTGTNVSIQLASVKTPTNFLAVVIGNMECKYRKSEVPPQFEGYLLEVTPKGILILARDLMGIQWGILRLKEIINIKQRYIPSMLIHDWPDVPWRGIYISMPRESQFEEFSRFVNEVLLPYQFNTVILEIDYKFQFKRHPEIKSQNMRSPEYCSKVSNYLRNRGLRIIPEFNCLGHQSGEKKNYALLKAHSEFDETPKLEFGDKRLYRRSWCPRNPKLPPLIFDMWNELINAFQSSYFHIGMDTVFHIANPDCPLCKTSTPWEIFSAAANQYHAYFSGQKNTVLMWGDRLLDMNQFKYSKYESSGISTFKAIKYLPRNIIICDWHYINLKEYPSLKYFQDEGFRVLACPGIDTNTVKDFWDYAMKGDVRTNLFLGFILRTEVPFKVLADGFFKNEKNNPEAEKIVKSITLLAKLCWQGKEE